MICINKVLIKFSKTFVTSLTIFNSIGGVNMIETEVVCPFCGESITILVDSSEEAQSYVENCSICCRPINFQIKCEDNELSQ